MKVRLLTSLAGHLPGNKAWALAPGEVYDAPPADARRLIERGMAEPLEGSMETTAIEPNTERAVQPRPRKRTKE